MMRLLTASACTFLLLATPATAQKVIDSDWCDDKGRGDAERFCEVREYNLDATGETIRVDASQNGGIKVEGWNRDEIRVLAKVTTRAKSMGEAEDLAEDVEVDIAGNSIAAVGPRMKMSRKQSYSVSFRLMVPHDSDVDLEAHNGGLTISKVSGDLEFETVNGGVRLEDVGGNVSGQTTNGGLDIELAGSSWDGEGIDVSTVNGGVKLALPTDFSAELYMSTVNGSLKTDFPITVKGKVGRTIKTTLGDGGPTIRVKTTNGGVRIKEA